MVIESSRERSTDLLIFGQGPVIDFETRDIILPTNTSAKEDLNLWTKNLARAAKVVFHHPESTTREVVVLGGKTGGEAYQSEAGLAIFDLTTGESAIPQENTRGEHRSTDTLENLVNYCNEILDNPQIPKGETRDLLGAPYHLLRMKVLMKLFDIPFAHTFSSDEVLRYHARTKDGVLRPDSEDWDSEELHDISRRLDINDAADGVGYYSSKKGTEQKTILARIQDDEVWTRALLTVPDYSLPAFAQIENDDRLRTVLRNFDTIVFPVTSEQPSVLAERNIDINIDTPDEIRKKLRAIKRIIPVEEIRDGWIKEHTAKGWPVVVEEKLNAILPQ